MSDEETLTTTVCSCGCAPFLALSDPIEVSDLRQATQRQPSLHTEYACI